jgi:outer membrane protein assembly factor BamE (lipoprotein component of BamABCDE complex)
MSNQETLYSRNGAFMRRTTPNGKKRLGRPIRSSLAAICIASSLSGCAANITKHGHVFAEEDLAQIKDGMSQDQVILALGTPDTKSTASQTAFYYISTTTERAAAFLNPEIVDRKVVAIYFDENNLVKTVSNYGYEDGKVIDFVTRKTPSRGSDDSLLKELFRNIGNPAGGAVPGGGGPNTGRGGGY